MSRISLGSSGASQVSRASHAAEAKVDRSPPRSEARAPDASAAHFRDEFVGSSSPKKTLAETKSPAAAQKLASPSAQSSDPGEAVKEILNKVREFLGGLFGGGGSGETNGGSGSSDGNGPVAQSPGKDKLVQGPPPPNGPVVA